MRLTKFRHSCLLVETADGRVLVDPGMFSDAAARVEGLSAVLVTHQHPDHVQPELLRSILDANPGARLHCDEGTAGMLAGFDPQVVREGDRLDLGVGVQVFGTDHAVIHPDLPRVTNVGYLLDGRLFHPGDALTVPDAEVEVLAVPAVAPWMAVREVVDYERAVRPRLAIPIHDAITTVPQIYDAHLTNLAPVGMTYRRIDEESLEL